MLVKNRSGTVQKQGDKGGIFECRLFGIRMLYTLMVKKSRETYSILQLKYS